MKDTFGHNVQKLKTTKPSFADNLCINRTFGHNVQKLRTAEESYVDDLCINGTFGHNVQKLRIAEVSYVADLYIKDASRQIVAKWISAEKRDEFESNSLPAPASASL